MMIESGTSLCISYSGLKVSLDQQEEGGFQEKLKRRIGNQECVTLVVL